MGILELYLVLKSKKILFDEATLFKYNPEYIRYKKKSIARLYGLPDCLKYAQQYNKK